MADDFDTALEMGYRLGRLHALRDQIDERLETVETTLTVVRNVNRPEVGLDREMEQYCGHNH